MAPGHFSLVKWYMDCVTDPGDAIILYFADLRWRGLHTFYSSVIMANDRLAESHSSMARYRFNSSDGQISVEFPRLAVSGRWEATAAPVQHKVFENPSGSILWNCLQPGSNVNLRVGKRDFNGLGYAECLTLTLPPWRLPMRQLRWGRFVSREDSLAWVDWQGSYSTSFAVHNGCLCDTLSVSDTEVVTRDSTLSMDESVTVRAGRLGTTILPQARALARLLPRSLFEIDEQKWRSRGILKTHDRSSRGWVIHEVVHWNI